MFPFRSARSPQATPHRTQRHEKAVELLLSPPTVQVDEDEIE